MCSCSKTTYVILKTVVISLVHRPTQIFVDCDRKLARGLGTKLVLHSSQYLVQFSDFASTLEYQLLSNCHCYLYFHASLSLRYHAW